MGRVSQAMPGKKLVIGNITQPDPTSVEGEIFAGEKKFTIHFITEQISLKSGREPFFCLGLLPAMRLGMNMEVNGEISEQLLRGSEKIQEIFSSWNPGWQKTEIRNVIPAKLKNPGSGGSACFFSGGIDSWYTFLRHLDEVTHLIFIHGLDVHYDDQVLHRAIRHDLERVAAHYGKQLIEVHTNLRLLFSHVVPWRMAMGVALVSVGHLLTDHFSKIYIPSSYQRNALIPYGSSPVVDYLWSSDKTQFIHDGCEASRMERTKLVVSSDVAMQTLHVCRENHTQEGNCGRCEKCQRTMLELFICGGLERSTTFQSPLNPSRLARLAIDPDALVVWYPIMEKLKQDTHNYALYKAVQVAISRSSRRQGANVFSVRSRRFIRRVKRFLKHL